MKNINLKYSLILLVFLITLSACVKDFEEINENPNNPTITNPSDLFTYILKEGGGEYDMFNTNASYLNRWVMYTAQFFGYSIMPSYENLGQSTIQILWESIYTKVLLNTNELMNITKEEPEDINKYAVARIWKVYMFQKVTDLWGSVPYSEAMRAIGEERILKPAYDNQEDIYEDMLKELTEAVADIDMTKPFFTDNADILFDGTDETRINLWIKFANSLKLKLAIRSGNQTVVSELMNNDNFISGNNESVTFQYIDTEADRNPWYDWHTNAPANLGQISDFMVGMLRSFDDPRLSIYAEPTILNPDTIIGMPNLMSKEEIDCQAFGNNLIVRTSKIGLRFLEEPDSENILLSYSELCFLKAEAALRAWGGSTPEEYYKEGIRANMEYFDIDNNIIEEYLVGAAAYNSNANSNEQLEQIITQKWIALYLNGFEAFAEYRRTGYPKLQKWDVNISEGTLNGLIDVDQNTVPCRIYYPSNELLLNSENYNNAIATQGQDNLYTKIWWATLNNGM